MTRLSIRVENLLLVLESYDQIKIYYDSTIDGAFTTELTTESTRIDIVPEASVYEFLDSTGTSSRWYKVSYYNSATEAESAKSSAMQGGTEEEKIGWTFNNYEPPDGEWGDIYTPDDMRYTMLFGIDSVAANTAREEFTDEQFRQLTLEAMAEFETFLTVDIRKRVYKTNPASSLKQSRLWREGVDYTDEEDEYPYDYLEWSNTGFLQLRHSPILSVERAIWKNLVGGTIMDLVENNWLRINKKMGQLNFYPKDGFSYGPYSVYGPIWTRAVGGRYPQGFEIDSSCGFKSAGFIGEDLRSVIAKYATIKALAVVGDGLLAGFSSQSISLDGLSESFSSTQSATSAYFGARIKQYSDEISEWLKRNRYKYSAPPMSFIGV